MYSLFQLLQSSTLTWFFFIFSNSLIKFILCSFVLLSSSISILLWMLWALPGQLFISVSLVVFSGLFLVHSFGTNSSVFSFCLALSVSVYLREKLSLLVLKAVPCMGASLCSLWMLSGSAGKAESGASMDHLFPQGMQAAITLVRGGAGDERG